MLKCQSSRTKGLVEDWTALFEPFKHNFYMHFNLENLGKKLTKLFATDEAPGRSISKELLDLRQREKNTLYPWEKKGQGLDLTGPESHLALWKGTAAPALLYSGRIRQSLCLFDCGSNQTQPKPSHGRKFPVEYKPAFSARKRKEYQDVYDGLDLNLELLGLPLGLGQSLKEKHSP